ncbi:MAG: aryl-sulfate sulfotransferase [Chitinophagales bacterium]|nr:aryl-sulfate sulfotransferase [Chitinophagales bacterium]
MKKIILLLCIGSTIQAQAQTMGFFYKDPASLDGYVLFAPGSSDTTYLIDKCGKRIHHWVSSYHPGLAVYLLSDGSLQRCGDVGNNQFLGGGTGGIVERYDWEGNLTWSYEISDNDQCQHHDVMPLPNGNVLAIVWESHTKDDALNNGRKTGNFTEMWSDKLVEIKPDGLYGGEIVWQWRAWDHLIQDNDASKLNYGVVKEHPELIDINLGTLSSFSADWLHINGVDFDTARNQIICSSHNVSELWVIDHSTTMDEAASHIGGKSGKGGDLLYRWGNPQNYDRGTTTDQVIHQQHNPTWIPATYPGSGSIMVFNNGVGQSGTDYSTVSTFTPPQMVDNNYPIEPDSAYDPKKPEWVYTADPANSFFSFVMGGAQRLSNGNTLICEANSGEMFEVDSASNEVWRYINPIGSNGKPMTQGNNPSGNSAFRCTYYPFNYPAFLDKDLIPGSPIENNPLAYDCTNTIPTGISTFISHNKNLTAYPNPFINSFNIYIPVELNNAILQVRDITGRILFEEKNFSSSPSNSIPIAINGYKGIVILSVHDVEGKNIWNATAVSQ